MKKTYETDTFKWKFNAWWKGSFTFCEAFLGGHLNIGKNITIFGSNAMNWTLLIHSKKYGFISIKLPTIEKYANTGKRYLKWHIYISPDATPSSATWSFNRGMSAAHTAFLRKKWFGHNWNTSDKTLNEYNDVLREYEEHHWTWTFEHYLPEEIISKWKNFYKKI